MAQMNKKIKVEIALLVSILVVIAIIIVLLVPKFSLVPHPPRPFDLRPERPVKGDIELFYTAKTIISSINFILLTFLIFTYIDIYKKTKSEFTIGLIIFSSTLLLYALFSNPLFHSLFGFFAFGLGPFAMLPDLFTCASSVVLLYLTYK